MSMRKFLIVAGLLVFAVSVLAAQDFDFQPIFGTQVITGDGWTSQLELTNPTSKIRFGTIIFLTSRGEGWKIEGSTNGPNTSFSLKPGETQKFLLGNPLGSLQTGWLGLFEVESFFWVTPWVSPSVEGVLTRTYNGLNFKSPLARASKKILVENVSDSTGIALVNADLFINAQSELEERVEIMAISDEVGASSTDWPTIVQETVSLSILQQKSWFIGELFAKNQKWQEYLASHGGRFRGKLCISSSNGGWITILAVNDF